MSHSYVLLSNHFFYSLFLIFVELIPCSGPEAIAVVDYTLKVLQAVGLRWGPAHTEVMLTADGPRLIEVNARWHAANFYPIVKRCYGYDALTATVDAYMNPGTRCVSNHSMYITNYHNATWYCI